MKLNKKLEIGIKVVTILRSQKDLVKNADLAKMVDTTPNFLVQIMHLLKNANIVNVKRGVDGGYTLNREIDITAYSIAKAVNTIDDDLTGEEGAIFVLRSRLIEAFRKTKI